MIFEQSDAFMYEGSIIFGQC